MTTKPTPRCLECAQPFDRERVPVMARPLSRMPGSRLVPAVSVTLYGSVCGPCAGVAPEGPPQAAQEAAGGAMTPKPADPPRQSVRCKEALLKGIRQDCATACEEVAYPIDNARTAEFIAGCMACAATILGEARKGEGE